MLTFICISFMNKEGVPAGADGFVDNFVNKEVNNF